MSADRYRDAGGRAGHTVDDADLVGDQPADGVEGGPLDHGDEVVGPGHAGHGGAQKKVPGSPQDMFEMTEYSQTALKKLNKAETRGMRKDWYKGVEALMTVVRVLPSDLYEKVVSGKGEVAPGASVPGSVPGRDHKGHEHKH